MFYVIQDNSFFEIDFVKTLSEQNLVETLNICCVTSQHNGGLKVNFP